MENNYYFREFVATYTKDYLWGKCVFDHMVENKYNINVVGDTQRVEKNRKEDGASYLIENQVYNIKYNNDYKYNTWGHTNRAKFWSIVNKSNREYGTEELINIVLSANSSEESSRYLAISLIKNLDYSQCIIGLLVFILVTRHKNPNIEQDKLFKFVKDMYYEPNTLYKKVDLELLTYIIRDRKNNIDDKTLEVLNDSRVLNIFLNKYKHWIDFSEIKLKKH